MQLPILVGMQVGYRTSREFTAREFDYLFKQLREIPNVSGVEVRFGGELDGKGRLVNNSMADVMRVCNSLMNSGMQHSFLHLSKLGLDLCAGNYGVEELRKVQTVWKTRLSKDAFADTFISTFGRVIGHCKEHDALFGRVISDINYRQLRRQLKRNGHQESRSKQKSLRQARELGLANSDLEKILLVENGYLPFNCLPEVVRLSEVEGKRICLDIGHVVRGLYDWHIPSVTYEQIKDSKFQKATIDYLTHADNRAFYFDTYKGEYITRRLYDWGSRAAHVHFHGNEKITEPKLVNSRTGVPLQIYRDHRPLNYRTLPPNSLQFGIISRLLAGGKASIKSATLELEKGFLVENPSETNPERLRLNVANITKSIAYFNTLI